MEFKYDGGGIAKGGLVTLYVDGQKAGEGRVDRTEPAIFSADETLDIGDEFAGSVSATMNTVGSIGQTAAAAGTGYLVAAYSWNVAFSVLGALGLIAALLFSRIDASKRVYSDPEPDETRGFAT